VQTTQVSQRLDQYMTQLTAHLFGGPVVYDHTFNLPYSDPVVQDAILAAQLALQGITSPLAFIGPNLMSNSVGLVGSSSNTVIDSSTDSSYVSLTEHISPVTILVGQLGACAGVTITGPTEGTPFGCTPGLGTPYFLVSGSTDLTVNTHTLTQVLQTTTTTSTYLTSQVYDLTGVPLNGSVPEPGTVSLVGIGLGGLLLVRRRMGRS